MATAQPQVSPELQNFLRQEQARAQMQQTIAKLTDVCWNKCMTGTPGSYLSSREQACFDNCAKRFLDTTQYVIQRFAHQQNAGGDGDF